MSFVFLWYFFKENKGCLKGTVSRLSEVYFLKLYQILAMKRNICKEIISMDQNDKK